MTTLLAAKFISGSSGRAHFPAGPASCLATAFRANPPPTVLPPRFTLPLYTLQGVTFLAALVVSLGVHAKLI